MPTKKSNLSKSRVPTCLRIVRQASGQSQDKENAFAKLAVRAVLLPNCHQRRLV